MSLQKGDATVKRVIELRGIRKSFGKHIVLNGVDFFASEGDFRVIVGENGSGKTTLLKIMIGLLLPDEGQVKVLGIDVKKHWKKLSSRTGVVLANERSLYWKLSAWENLDIFGGIYGVPRKVRREKAKELLERVGLWEHKDKPVENFSTGMRKRLLLCKALIHNPKILFIDEILNGLDPAAVREMVDYLSELNSSGLTIVMISHVLHVLPDNAQVALLRNGKIEIQARYRDIKGEKNDVYKVFERLIKGSDGDENDLAGDQGD